MYRLLAKQTSAVPAVLFLLLLELQVCLTSRAITCTAGAFADGALINGAITCDFNQDVNSTQHNFNVVHYPFRHTDSVISDSGNYIVLCNWAQNRQLECKVDDGYSFNHHVTSTLRVGVKRMSKRVEGMYVCQLVPDQGIPVTTCNLTVKENVLPDATDTTESSSAAEEKRCGVQLREAKTQVHQLLIVVVILGIVVGILIVVLIVLICCCRKTISSKLRILLSRFRTQAGQTGENSPLEDVPLMDISKDVKYPENTSHTPTQVFIDTAEKSTQFGKESGVMSDNKSTQLYLNAEKKFLTGVLKAGEGDVELTGSSERFRNPVYSTIAPPMKLSEKYEETDVAKRNSKLYANVSDDQNGKK